MLADGAPLRTAPSCRGEAVAPCGASLAVAEAHPAMARAIAVAELCSRLPPADAELVRSLAGSMPAWESRAARLAERDGAVRQAMAGYVDRRPSRAAVALAEELQHPFVSGDAARTALLRRINMLSGPTPLKWRQILNVMDGSRGG